MTTDVREICRKALAEFGSGHQINKAKEELFELGAALSHYTEGRASMNDVRTEIADVLIMASQLALLFGEQEVTNEMERKLGRLSDRLGMYRENPKLEPVVTNIDYYYGG